MLVEPSPPQQRESLDREEGEGRRFAREEVVVDGVVARKRGALLLSLLVRVPFANEVERVLDKGFAPRARADVSKMRGSGPDDGFVDLDTVHDPA